MKRIASLSIDLDNLWTYLKISGDDRWKEFPSFLDLFIPRFLDLLDELELKITFFIVGQDAAVQTNRASLREIIQRGHEVANHSFHHEPWLHQYSRLELEHEIASSEEAILAATGQKPIGFRGPGFSWSPTLLQVLSERGYLYDSTSLPSFIGPIARMYYFWKTDLSGDAMQERKQLFGSFTEGFRSVNPYMWQLENGQSLLELPITTIPMIKLPFHMSYLMYLSSYSTALMQAYLNLAIHTCRARGVSPNFLLHPTDILGGDAVPEMQFFPGMALPSERKQELFITVIQRLKRYFEFVNMSTKATVVLKENLVRV